MNAVDQNGRAEDRAVQRGADGAVRAFPHPVELVFLHALGVGRDGRALDADTIMLDCLGGVQRDPVGGAVALRQTEVKIDRFQVDVRLQKLAFDLLPEDPGHLVAVQLDQRCFHFNFLHGCLL